MLGRLRETAGWRERELGTGPGRLSALRDLLQRENPALGAALNGAGVRAAVNKTLVRDDADLAPGDEVAFLPPMSGG